MNETEKLVKQVQHFFAPGQTRFNLLTHIVPLTQTGVMPEGRAKTGTASKTTKLQKISIHVTTYLTLNKFCLFNFLA